MGHSFSRALPVVGVAAAVLAVIAFGAVGTGVIHLTPQPASMAQPCVQGSALVPTLFGDDTTTQIRVSTPDMKTQRVLRTEPASRLPAMFESLLSVSGDSSRLAYVTADDERMDNARVTYVDVAHPEAPHVIATLAAGLLPIRPVWSPTGDQLAFVVSRSDQGQLTYHTLAASTSGGPILDIGTLSSDAFSRLESNQLCVTSSGAVTVVPPPAPRNGDLAAAATPGINLASPARVNDTTTTGVGGGTRCSLPVLSQNDPRWKDHKMQPTGESVGQVGCAVTSAAMVLDYFSANLSPDQLSDCLGTSAVPIYWSQAVACTGGRVSGAVATEFSWQALDSVLAAGRPAIVGMLGGPVGMHFVVVTSGGGDVADRYHIVDPWNGRSDATLGSYTRKNWTLFQLVDFRGVGPGCGQLLVTGPDDPLKVLSGITDGAWYHGVVKLHRLVAGVPVTVEKLSHDSHQDETWQLGSDLTLTEDGSYHVIIGIPAGDHPTVLSFTIDNLPPTVGVKFFDLISTIKVPGGGTEPELRFPGRFAVYASDPLTGIIKIQAQLDNQPVWDRNSVAGIANRALFGVAPAAGQHHLTYSATNAVGLSSSGQVTFVVQASTSTVPVPIQVPPGLVAPPSLLPPTLNPRPLPSPPSLLPPTVNPQPLPSPIALPTAIVRPTIAPPVYLICATLTSVNLTDTVTTSVGGHLHTLSWSGNGTCGPFNGTLTASYTTYLFCVAPCLSRPFITTKTYTISGASGTFQDQVGSSVAAVTYKLTLTDGRGTTATGSAT